MDGPSCHPFVIAGVAALSLMSPAPAASEVESVPDWAATAVWYQVFPERFANGDPSNDPLRQSLERPRRVAEKWAPTPWTGDWYLRAGWEKQRGDDFYGSVYDRRYGGDLAGVIERLDYLVDLGINAIYFNPMFHAASLHKYDATSFHHIDPYFGPDPAGDLALMEAETEDPATWAWTTADRLFLELLAKCHERGVRVVIDGVFNHTGRRCFAFQDVIENQADSRYHDWYVVRSFDDPQTPENEFRYEGWWGAMSLPIFADNAAGDDLAAGPKAYVHAITRRWMDPDGDGDPSDGVDGWRLDVANEVPIGFWAEWNRLVREVNPAAYTVAEHWEDAAEFLDEGGFSATMNYHGFAQPVKAFVIDGRLPASRFAQLLVDRMLAHPERRRHAMQNLIDSHDTPRVASMTVNARRQPPYENPTSFDYDAGRWNSPRGWDRYEVRAPRRAERRLQRIVAVLQATCVGAPMLYYGTEAGMWGADDPDDRKPMVWPDLAYDDEASDPRGRTRVADPVGFDHGLHAFYRFVLKMRTTMPVLSQGGFEVLRTDDAAKALVFRRRLDDQSVYVVVNRGDGPWSVALDADRGRRLKEVFTASGEPHRVRVDPLDAGGVRVTVPEREAAVLMPAE